MNFDLIKVLGDLVGKLGKWAAFVPLLLGELKKALTAKDVAKVRKLAADVRARAVEMHEAADALTIVADKAEAAVADNEVDAQEAIDVAAAITHAIDEAEDIVTGKDEDDV